jgi:hypothetical protein
VWQYNQQYFSLLTSLLHSDYTKIENLIANINWDHFYSFLVNNSLAVSMYGLCQKSAVKNLVPERIQQHSKFLYFKQWTRNEILWQETQRIKQIMTKSSIDVIFLKGVIFADRFYGSIEKRAIGDIDILVKKQDIANAHHVLMVNGYIRNSRILLHEKLCMYFTHHYEYSKQNADLDLHWAISSHPSHHIDYDQIWRIKQQWQCQGVPFTVLPGEYELVLQILSIFKDAQLGTLHAKSLLDAYVIMQKIAHGMDWINFFENRRKEGLFLISLNVMFLLSSLLMEIEFPEIQHVLQENKKNLCGLPHLDWQKNTSWQSKISNKYWGWRQYDSNIAKSFFWWAASLPFCFAVYR